MIGDLTLNTWVLPRVEAILPVTGDQRSGIKTQPHQNIRLKEISHFVGDQEKNEKWWLHHVPLACDNYHHMS